MLPNIALHFLILIGNTTDCNTICQCCFHKISDYVCGKLYIPWLLTDSNGIRTHNHLVCKRTLSHLAELSI